MICRSLLRDSRSPMTPSNPSPQRYSSVILKSQQIQVSESDSAHTLPDTTKQRMIHQHLYITRDSDSREYASLKKIFFLKNMKNYTQSLQFQINNPKIINRVILISINNQTIKHKITKHQNRILISTVLPTTDFFFSLFRI